MVFAENKNSSLALIIAMFLILMMAGSCSRKLTFAKSTTVPAAEGYVKLKKDQNKNTRVQVRVTNLASPRQLDPPKNVYVVWLETQHDGTKNIGAITSSSPLFSSKLKGSLQTVTPYKVTGVFITAEDNATIHYPSGYVVLRTK